MASFLSDTIGKGCRETDSRIEVIYKRWDRGLKGVLDENDFLRFYAAAAYERERVVRDHLAALGYDDQLQNLRGLESHVIGSTYCIPDGNSKQIAANRSARATLELHEALSKSSVHPSDTEVEEALGLHESPERRRRSSDFKLALNLHERWSFGKLRTPEEKQYAANQVRAGIHDSFPSFLGSIRPLGEVKRMLQEV